MTDRPRHSVSLAQTGCSVYIGRTHCAECLRAPRRSGQASPGRRVVPCCHRGAEGLGYRCTKRRHRSAPPASGAVPAAGIGPACAPADISPANHYAASESAISLPCAQHWLPKVDKGGTQSRSARACSTACNIRVYGRWATAPVWQLSASVLQCIRRCDAHVQATDFGAVAARGDKQFTKLLHHRIPPLN